MKATSSQLKSFLRTCKNAYVTVDLGNGPMMVKIIKSALSEDISSEEYNETMWHYEFMQTDSGLDLKLGDQTISKENIVDFEALDSMREPKLVYATEPDSESTYSVDMNNSSPLHE